MRVAVTVEQCWHDVPGGTASATIDLLRALNQRDDVDVVGVAARHTAPPQDPWRPPVEVDHLPLPRPLLYESWHAPVWRWPPVQRATGPVDVIHATAVAFPPTSAPIVVTVHDLAFLHDPRRATRHGHRFFRRGMDLAREHAALVLCPSQATADDCAANGFDTAKLRVVPWGVDVPVVTDGDVERARTAHDLTPPYVTFVGTVEPRKNLPALLDAFERVRHGAQLVIVGPQGWNEDITRALARLDGRVRTVGFVPPAERDAIVAGAAAFCYPSLSEGFGLPVLEAMAVGTPVITSRGTSTEEVAGDAAILVDPHDRASITEAIGRLLDDSGEAERLRSAGHARVAAFTWERCAELTTEAYRTAAGS